MGGISTNSKKLGVLQLVAIYNLKQLGKLPQSPMYDDILEKVLPKLSHKIVKANQMLLSDARQN